LLWAAVHGWAAVRADQAAIGFWLCGWAIILLWAEGLAGPMSYECRGIAKPFTLCVTLDRPPNEITDF